MSYKNAISGTHCIHRYELKVIKWQVGSANVFVVTSKRLGDGTPSLSLIKHSCYALPKTYLSQRANVVNKADVLCVKLIISHTYYKLEQSTKQHLKNFFDEYLGMNIRVTAFCHITVSSWIAEFLSIAEHKLITAVSLQDFK